MVETHVGNTHSDYRIVFTKLFFFRSVYRILMPYTAEVFFLSSSFCLIVSVYLPTNLYVSLVRSFDRIAYICLVVCLRVAHCVTGEHIRCSSMHSNSIEYDVDVNVVSLSVNSLKLVCAVLCCYDAAVVIHTS